MKKIFYILLFSHVAFAQTGIGTTAPAVKLHVKSNGPIFRLEGADHAYLELYPQGAGTRYGYLGFPTANSTQLSFMNQFTTGSIAFGTNGTNRMFLNSDGKFGLGIATPETSLHIENGNTFGTDPSITTSPSVYIFNNNNTSTSAHSSLTIRTNESGGGNPYLSFDIKGVKGYSMGIDNADGDKFKFQNNWSLNNTAIPVLTITPDNRVGIGTTSPAAALHVAPSVGQSVGSYGFLNTAGAGSGNFSGTISYSIQADQRIRAAEFNAVSDTRIKKDIVPLNTTKQLSDLNKLKVVNYSYIDQLVNGNKSKTGFIAQEVEKVNTQFVNQSADFIPSVFAIAKATRSDQNGLFITTVVAHGFAKGDVVKFFAEGKKEVIKTIDAVFSPDSFSIKEWNEPTDNLFVYGKKVADFRAIDFDQITALSVAAIQELSKQIEKLQLENTALNKLINNKIQAKQSELEKRLLQLESKRNKKKR